MTAPKKRKTRVRGKMTRDDTTKKQVLVWNKGIYERLESEFDFDSISTLVNFLALEHFGDADLSNDVDSNDYFGEEE